MHDASKDDNKRQDFLQGLRKASFNGSFIITGYSVIGGSTAASASSLKELEGQILKHLQGRNYRGQQQPGQGGQGSGWVIPSEVMAEAGSPLKGVQTHLQLTLETGLLYRCMANATYPIHILAEGAKHIRNKDIKKKLEFANQRRNLYLPYSAIITEMAQAGWDVPPVGLLLRLGACESFQAAGNDIVQYREMAFSNMFQRKLRIETSEDLERLVLFPSNYT